MRYYAFILTVLLLCVLFTGCGNALISSAKQKTEKYSYYDNNELVIADLVTDGKWQGDKSREIHYNAKKAPWIFNANFKRISDISAKYYVSIYKKEYGPFISERVYDRGIESIAVINDTGEYVIDISVSGMSFEAKIGVEP